MVDELFEMFLRKLSHGESGSGHVQFEVLGWTTSVFDR
jgi:hypothetical protein